MNEESHEFITGARVKSVYQIRTFRGMPKTVTRPGVFLSYDPEDTARALVRFDGEDNHISHPLLAILEIG